MKATNSYVQLFQSNRANIASVRLARVSSYLQNGPPPALSYQPSNRSQAAMADILRDIYEGNPRKIGAFKTSYQASRKVAVALSLDLTGEEHTDRPVLARVLHKYLATSKSPIHHNVLRWPPGSADGPITSVFVSQVVFLKDDLNLRNRDLEERDEDRAAKAWLVKHGMEESELEWVSFWDRYGFVPFGIEVHRPVMEYTYTESRAPRKKEEWEENSDREIERQLARMVETGEIKEMVNQRK